MSKLLSVFALLLLLSASSQFPCQGQQYYGSQGRQISLKQVGPVRYTSLQDTSSIVATGNIVVLPKDGFILDDLLNLEQARGQLSVVKDEGGERISERSAYLLQPRLAEDLFRLANYLYESNMVEFSHPDFIVKVQFMSNPPTDPLYNQQYYLNNTGQVTGFIPGKDSRAEAAWAITKGLNHTRVAVIDEGVEPHVDLVASASSTASRVTNGWPAANNGRPLTRTIGSYTYKMSHGQNVAGIIGATHDNGIGIAGMSPCSDVVPLNIYENSGSLTGNNSSGLPTAATVSNLANAFHWAASVSLNPGVVGGAADVLCCSWALGTVGLSFPNLEAAINDARTLGRNGKGCPVVFSAGNHPAARWNYSNTSPIYYPADLPNVITVGSCPPAAPINSAYTNASVYSSHGAELDLVAVSDEWADEYACNTNHCDDPYPGVTTLTVNDGYLSNFGNLSLPSFGGTSAAAPQVAGVAALMISVNPNLTEVQVRTILQSTAAFIGTASGTGPGPAANAWNADTGYGRLDAGAAVAAAAPISGPATINFVNSVYSVPAQPAGTTISWTFTVDGMPFPSCNTNPNAYPNKMNGPTLVFDDPNPCAMPNFYQHSATMTATLSGPCGTAVLTRNFIIPGTPGPQRATVATYPNPANDLLHVELDGSNSTAKKGADVREVTLSDIYGRVKRTIKSTTGSLDIRIADLPEGIYILRAATGSGTTVKQIEVKH